MLTILLTVAAVPVARAQNEPAPDLRMLLNLDLFKPTPNSSSAGDQSSDGSMFEQIQTLTAMGYLTGAAPNSKNPQAESTNSQVKEIPSEDPPAPPSEVNQ